MLFLQRSEKMVSQDDPQISMTELPWEPGDLDLFKFGFYFAIQQVDERVGSIRAELVDRNSDKDKKREPIELVDCAEFLPDGEYAAYGEELKQKFSVEKLLSGSE